MMRLFVIWPIFLVQFVFSQTPVHVWAKGFQGASNDQISNVISDIWGNVYVSGLSTGTVDLDPGPSTLLASSTSSAPNLLFVCKLNGNGDLQWARTFDVSGLVGSLAVDNTGNLFIAGLYMNTCDFDPGPGLFTLTSSSVNVYTGFICKLNSSGNFLGAVSFGENSLGRALIAINQNNELYYAASFNGVSDFDPGISVTSFTSTSSSRDGVLCKFNLSLGFIWAKQIKATVGCEVADLELTSGGEPLLLLSVYGNGYLDLDPGPGSATYSCSTPYPSSQVVLGSYDGNGALSWGGQMYGSSGSNSVSDAFARNSNGNLFLTANIMAQVDIDPGLAITMVNSGNYVVELSPAGNLLNYDTIAARPSQVEILQDTLFFSGSFNGTLDLDPSPGFANVTSAGSGDVFVFSLDDNFQFKWGKAFGGSGPDIVTGLCVTDNKEIYLGGGWSNTVDFDPGPSTNTLSSTGAIDGFLSKFSSCPDMPVNLSGNSICSGRSATLVGASPSQVSWFISSTGGPSVGSGSIFTTNTLTAGTHTFYASASSCSAMARTPFLVNVNMVPSLSVSSPTGSLCVGSTATLQASGAHSYTWTNGPATPKYVVSPTVTSVYMMSGLDTLNLCSFTLSVQVQVSQCLRLGEVQIREIRAYPNPSEGNFTIEGLNNSVVEVFDSMGRKVHEGSLCNGTLNISEHAEGLYIMTIRVGDSVKVVRLVISK